MQGDQKGDGRSKVPDFRSRPNMGFDSGRRFISFTVDLIQTCAADEGKVGGNSDVQKVEVQA